MSIEAIERDFPDVVKSNYRITSDMSADYNCVAWAAGDTQSWWEPNSYWPAGLPREGTVETYVKLFESLGFARCSNTDAEAGFEKIAIYGAHGEFMHVARQLANGKWTSKLGPAEDIEHDDVMALCGIEYGSISDILRRSIQDKSGTP